MPEWGGVTMASSMKVVRYMTPGVLVWRLRALGVLSLMAVHAQLRLSLVA
jgi:hypothetical protein